MDKEFKTLSKRVVYQNPWMTVYEHKIQRRDSEGIYGVVERSDSVIIVPLTVSQKTVLLRQYRYPTDADSWELPMGQIESHETKEQAVERELLEETKLVVTDYKQIGEYCPVPGLTKQKVFVFVVNVSDAELQKTYAPKNTDEIQETKILTLRDAYQMILDGEITDGFTLVGFLYLKLYLDRTFAFAAHPV